MKTATNQHQIAEATGLSRTAVSFALNDKLRNRLRPETSQRVLDTASRMGYVPHRAARRLARARAENPTAGFDQVGIIHLAASDEYVDPVCLAILQGAEHDLSERNASLVFVRVREDKDWRKVERLARAREVDGWLLYGNVEDPVVDRLQPSRLPHVVLGDHRCTTPAHGVTVDHTAAGRLAVQHLASLGHRRIAFLAGGTGFVYQQRSHAGFRAALQEFGLEEDERLVRIQPICTGTDMADAVAWLRHVDPMPTAVFSVEMNWALGLSRELQKSNLRVPQDISLLSCESSFQPLPGQDFTRIELPMVDIGRRGASMLYDLARRTGMQPQEERIAPSLIEGWSSCPLRTGAERGR